MFVVGDRTAVEAGEPRPLNGFWLIYATGVLVMLIRLVLNMRAVFRLIKRGSAEPQNDYVLVRLPDDRSPSFSFGRYLVLNQTDALTQPDALLRHERTHICQRHTADVLFIELVQAAFWFSPVPWVYKRALQEVHEFLADRAARAGSPADYARQLVAYALHVPASALLTPFVSQSTLKQRIVMLQKPQSHRRALLGYVVVLPLAGCLFMCTQTERDQPKTEAAQHYERATRKPASLDGEVFMVVEQQPEFPGGMEKLGKYLSENLNYPAAAKKASVQGRVFVNFIVTKTGDVTDVNILKDVGFGTGEEAVRVVSQMPRWKPGKQDGRPVNVRYNLPINFELDEPAR